MSRKGVPASQPLPALVTRAMTVLAWTQVEASMTVSFEWTAQASQLVVVLVVCFVQLRAKAWGLAALLLAGAQGLVCAAAVMPFCWLSATKNQ